VAILIDGETNVIVQGGTGKQGSFHVKLMKEYGTRIVGLVTPGSRLDNLEGIPVYNSVTEAIKASRVDATLVFVPPMACKEAVAEAAYNGVKLIVVITEHVPLHDAIIMKRISNQKGAMLIGPNTIGVISAGLCKMGVMPADLYRPGVVGIVSRSGTLTHEVSSLINESGQGVSTVVDIGGDMVVGTTFVEIVEMFQQDPATEAIGVIGEVGGMKEQDLASYLKDSPGKPIVTYIAGRSAPPEKRMGLAGALISGTQATAEAKVRALREAGTTVVDYPDQIPAAFKKLLEKVDAP